MADKKEPETKAEKAEEKKDTKSKKAPGKESGC